MFDDVKKGEKLMKNIKSKIIKWLKNTMSELLSKSIKREINTKLNNKMSELGEINKIANKMNELLWYQLLSKANEQPLKLLLRHALICFKIWHALIYFTINS